jgi:uncharacterized protein YjbJ (UPF0337 family)
VRAVLAQRRPRLDIASPLAEGKWLFVSLSPGVLGEPASRLLGAVLTYTVWTAIEARAALPRDQRQPVFLYLDELQSLSTLPFGLEYFFERARGLGCGVTVATQALGRLPQNLQQSLLGYRRVASQFPAGVRRGQQGSVSGTLSPRQRGSACRSSQQSIRRRRPSCRSGRRRLDRRFDALPLLVQTERHSPLTIYILWLGSSLGRLASATTHSDHRRPAMGEKTDKIIGRAKQALGAVTGNEEMKRKGQRQEDKGKLKGTVDSTIGKAQDALGDLKKKVNRR